MSKKANLAVLLTIATMMNNDKWNMPKFNEKQNVIYIPKRKKPKGSKKR